MLLVHVDHKLTFVLDTKSVYEMTRKQKPIQDMIGTINKLHTILNASVEGLVITGPYTLTFDQGLRTRTRTGTGKFAKRGSGDHIFFSLSNTQANTGGCGEAPNCERSDLMARVKPPSCTRIGAQHPEYSSIIYRTTIANIETLKDSYIFCFKFIHT